MTIEEKMEPKCELRLDDRCDIEGVELKYVAPHSNLYGVIKGCYNECPYQQIIDKHLYCTNKDRIQLWLDNGN